MHATEQRLRLKEAELQASQDLAGRREAELIALQTHFQQQQAELQVLQDKMESHPGDGSTNSDVMNRIHMIANGMIFRHVFG